MQHVFCMESRTCFLSHGSSFPKSSHLSQFDDELKFIFEISFIGWVHPLYFPPFPLIVLQKKHKYFFYSEILLFPSIILSLKCLAINPRRNYISNFLLHIS